MTDTLVITTPSVVIGLGPPGAPGAAGTDGTHGQNGLPSTNSGRLIKSGSNLLLQPYHGNQMVINGSGLFIPQAGVTLDSTGTTPNALLYIYAVDTDNDGVIDALEPSGTPAVSDPSTGVMVMPGAPNLGLVGMAMPGLAGAWVDAPDNRRVRSWYNRRSELVSNSFTGVKTTASATAVELASEIRINMLVWADEIIDVSAICWVSNSVAAITSIGVSLDGNAIVANHRAGSLGPDGHSVSARDTFTPSEGLHYVTIFGSVSSGTGNFGASAVGFGTLTGVLG